jgi:uncharacterized membrane protein YidH (DUF202 family)
MVSWQNPNMMLAIMIIIMGIISIANASIVIQAYNEQPSLQKNHPHNFNFVVFNLVCFILLMGYAFYLIYAAIANRGGLDFTNIKTHLIARGVFILILITSIATTSIGIEAFNEIPALKEAHNHNFNYLVFNLVCAILCILYVFRDSYKLYAEIAAI